MPTVTALKHLFQNQIAPGNDGEFLRLLTEADMRLLEFGRWRWTRKRVEGLVPVDGIISLPAAYASIIGAQVSGYATTIRDDLYEFVPDGVGEVEVDGADSVRLIDQGIDDVSGLRTYKVTGTLPASTTINAMCHLAPVALYDPDNLDGEPPEGVTDTTVCPDSAALKLMMYGILYEEANDMKASSDFVSTALRGLDNKERTQRGGAMQQINVRPLGTGFRKIQSFR